MLRLRGKLHLDPTGTFFENRHAKMENIVDSGAEEVVTACPACMMQIADMLGRNQTDIKVRHSLEILAETLTAGK